MTARALTWIPQLTANRYQYALDKFGNCRFLNVHLLGEIATGVIARFCGSLAALLLLAECNLLRRRALPESRKNAHSHPSN